MTCHKLAFHSPEQAERTAAVIQAQGLRSASTAPRRAYLCPHCDLWHWTSSPKSYDGVESVEFAVAPLSTQHQPKHGGTHGDEWSVDGDGGVGVRAPVAAQERRAVLGGAVVRGAGDAGRGAPAVERGERATPGGAAGGAGGVVLAGGDGGTGAGDHEVLPDARVGPRGPGAPPKAKPGPVENLRSVTVKMQRLETNLAWAKDALRVALSRWQNERTEDAAIELAVVANSVVSLSRTQSVAAAGVLADIEREAASKREWLRAPRVTP
jgi:hypothetical protein